MPSPPASADHAADIQAPLVLRIVGLLAAAGFVVTTLRAVLLDHHPVPWLDDWHSAREAAAFADGRFSVAQWVDQHNEHRIPVPKLAFLADHLLAAGTGVITQSILVTLQCVHAALLARLLAPTRCPRLGWIGLPAVVACMLGTPQVLNLTWNIQLSVIGVYAFVTTCLVALAHAARPGVRPLPWIVVAIGCALAATFTRANGVVVWPLALGLAWLVRLGPKTYASLGVLAALGIGTFFYGYETPSTGSEPLESLRDLPQVFAFAVGYLGLPLRALGPTAAAALGTVGVVLATLALLRLLTRRRSLSRRDAVLHVLLLFVCATAGATALGRLRYPPPDWPSRYVTPVMLFWATTIALWTRVLARRTPSPLTHGATALLVAFVAWLAFLQVGALDELRPRHDARRLAALASWSGVYDEPVLQTVTLDFAPLSHDVTLELATRGWAHHASPRAAWTGRAVRELFHVEPEAADTRGSLDGTENLPAPTAGVLVSGTITTGAVPTSVHAIVLARASTGEIVGHGETDLVRGEQAADTSRTWTGYARVLETPGEPLRAWIVTAGDGDPARPRAWPLRGRVTPRLVVDPRTDSLGKELFELQERGPRDLKSEIARSAGGFAPYLGVTLPSTPTPSGATPPAHVERLPGSPAVRVRGDLAPAQAVAVLAVDEQLRVLGIGLPDAERAYDFLAVPLAVHDVSVRICAIDAAGGLTRVTTRPHGWDPVPVGTTASLDELGPEVRAFASTEGDWPAPRSAASTGILATYLPNPAGSGTVFDSWNGDDRNRGTLRLAPIDLSQRPSAARRLGLPILAGPRPSALSIRVVDRDAPGEPVLRLDDLAPFANHWRIWRIDLPESLDTERLAIVIEDAGAGYGCWIAVGMPHWID